MEPEVFRSWTEERNGRVYFMNNGRRPITGWPSVPVEEWPEVRDSLVKWAKGELEKLK